MAEVALTFELVDMATGLWCTDCALSSGVQATLMMSHGNQSSLSTIKRCGDCGGDRVC